MQKIKADLSQIKSPFSTDISASRVETGALQINDDWPGVFVRGDNAIFYAQQLRAVLSQRTAPSDMIDIIAHSSLEGLASLLMSCSALNQNQTTNQLNLNFDGDRPTLT